MNEPKRDSAPADEGRLETPVRPAAWWRLSTLPECRPCVTTCADEAQQWRDEGHDVRALGDVEAETKRCAALCLRPDGWLTPPQQAIATEIRNAILGNAGRLCGPN
jgi:hypothetical protein